MRQEVWGFMWTALAVMILLYLIFGVDWPEVIAWVMNDIMPPGLPGWVPR